MDVSAMAERISSAASAPPPAAESSVAPVVEMPAATPVEQAAPPAVAEPVAAAEPDLQFDDDPAPIDFDAEEPAQQASAPEPPKVEAVPEDQKGIADLQALLKAGGLPKQVEDALMRTNRGRNLLALYKSERILKETPNYDPATGRNVGGLGFMPTPEQVKEYHQGHADFQASQQEFTTNPQSWAVNWFGPDSAGNFRQGIDQVLPNIPQVIDQAYNHAVNTGNEALRQQTVELYRSVFKPMLESYLGGFYERARSIANPQDRENWINAARIIEGDMFEKTRPDEQLAPPGPTDALAERERSIEERERRMNAWQTKAQTDAQKATEDEIFVTIDQRLAQDCERALMSIKAGKTEREFRALVNDFKKEIQDAVRKDHVGWRDFNFSLSTARTARGAEARTAPVQTYRQIAQRVIQSRYRPYLQELASDAVRQNGALHTTAAHAAAQTAPAANGGQPPSQSVVAEAKIARLPGESQTDWFERRIRNRMGSPN